MSDNQCSRTIDKGHGIWYECPRPVVERGLCAYHIGVDKRADKRAEEVRGTRSNIIVFPTPPQGDKPRVCSNCGGEWFSVAAITLRDNMTPSGYTVPAKCIMCGLDARY